MEFTIKQIISMDKDAEKFRKQKDDEIENMKLELNKFLIEMEEDSEREIAKNRKEINSTKISEAESIVAKIKSEKEEEVSNINKNYELHKGQIIDGLLQEILNSN